MATYARAATLLPGPTEYQLIAHPARGPVVRLQCPLCRSIYGVDASAVAPDGAVAVECPRGDYDDEAVLQDWDPTKAASPSDFGPGGGP